MRLTVYQLEHSPYCIPITRALGALGLPLVTRNVSNADRREIIEMTNGAYYQVPVLSHDGKVIFESSPSSIDVARYVDRSFAGGRLFPPAWEGLQRIVIPYIEDNVESVTFKLVDPLYLREIGDPVERAMVRRHKERKFGRDARSAGNWNGPLCRPKPSGSSHHSTWPWHTGHFFSTISQFSAILRCSGSWEI